MLTKTNVALAMLITDNMLKTKYILNLQKRYLKVKNLNETYVEDIAYLVDMLNRNEIRLDEFDLIALSHVQKKS